MTTNLKLNLRVATYNGTTGSTGGSPNLQNTLEAHVYKSQPPGEEQTALKSIVID